LPAGQDVAERLAVAVADATERVRAVPHRGGRLRAETVEAAVTAVRPGACCLHALPSIRVALHGQTTSKARVPSMGSLATLGLGDPRSSSRKQAASGPPASRTSGHRPCSPIT